MKTVFSILAALLLPVSAHAQNVYSVSNTPCSGAPLVCSFSLDSNLVREVANLTLTFNSDQSPSNQKGNPFDISIDYGLDMGSSLSFTANELPVIWGYRPGGFYEASFVLQLGSSQATKLQVSIDFKQISNDRVLGTFWAVYGKQDAANGADLTQAY